MSADLIAVHAADSDPGASVALLDVRHLSATYLERGRRLRALDDVSLTVGEREIVALIGPSGCGKSTLLDIIAGLLAADSGEIRIAGEVMDETARLGRAAYMRQRDLLLPWRTAVGNAALALEVAGVGRRRAEAIARDRFPAFGLAGFESAYPSQLSGGMRQRVAFLRTVLAARSLLLLDEPFGALDALTRSTSQSWLLDLWERQRQAILLVTHDVEEAVFLADRVVVLSPRPGRIVREVAITLPRPRQRAMVTDPVFAGHVATILRALGLIDGAAA
jgi:ABC-type nitrate/sulfonate/bicarbonate transport system ATPase subunit